MILLGQVVGRIGQRTTGAIERVVVIHGTTRVVVVVVSYTVTIIDVVVVVVLVIIIVYPSRGSKSVM